MLEWIKNLEPEFLILIFGVVFVAFLSLISIAKAQRTLDLIGKRALDLREDLMKRDGVEIVDIVIANTSYVNVEVVAAGLIYKRTLLPLKEESVMILARDSHKISIPLDALRAYVLGSKLRMKRLYVYVEDALGRRIKKRAKNSVRVLKKVLKNDRKALRIDQKKQRFATGNYRFFERTGLVFEVIFSPFTKLARTMKNNLNRKLRNREVNIEILNIEKKHKQEMQDMFDEARRENQKLETEKKILEQEKEAVAQAKLAVAKRREEFKRVATEIKKNEEERKRIELELQNSKVEFEEDSAEVKNEKVGKPTEVKADVENSEVQTVIKQAPKKRKKVEEKVEETKEEKQE